MSSRKSKGERDAKPGVVRPSPHVSLSRTESTEVEESAAAQIRRRAVLRPDNRSSRGERAFLVGIESRQQRRTAELSSVTKQAKLASQAARAQRTKVKHRAEA